MSAPQRVNVTINGRNYAREISPRVLLADFLRDELGLTGTKVSCGMQICGVCTVIVDGEPVSSCNYLAVDVDGRELQTIEGLADGDELHPIQQAFIDEFGLQCGYCTPGFIMAAKNLVDEHPKPSLEAIEHHLDGNLCRCTGYETIVHAVQRAIGERSGDNAHG